ncbi:TFIIB-type zinc finger domain-containing protein [Pseudoroseicyclus tamaricis]|uniref:Primosomal protein N' (Replication factor Y)-superfamily II helicase n=1 Tax=Pseudoroseicyclus tamaricis TaxID=2705421 RepID=A0A6B2JNN6_9RHOB|nr:TFIIB-type zinc finger domain-containing protein [Pseudoroseicyclus tamaricis]NDU99544.1 primosomal protein N' (replication factor Y) - superfamily II helicase [Pseudoroseicyclus tamaricis]
MSDYGSVPKVPHAPPAPPSPEGDEEFRFPCDQCGADMRYEPGTGRLVCDHCGNVAELESGQEQASEVIRELDYEDALRSALPAAEMEEVRSSHCPNCGAVIEFAEAEHATECPFCATPVVTDTGTTRHIKPKGLLPFVLTEPEARQAMGKWLGKLWFAPNGLQDYARKGRKMRGIYVPYWTYDADTQSSYTGMRGTHYYVTRTVMRDGKPTRVRERRTRWSPRSGRVSRWFDDILVLASRTLPKSYTDGLEPWDLTTLEPYRPDFLAGFQAEGYQVQLEEGFSEARQIMDRQILRDVRFDIGGDEQRVTSVKTHVSDVTFKHVLLPVWTAAYKFKGKSYRFVVNAQSGKVQGERPWSWIKITIAVVLGLIVAGGLGYAYSVYGG